MAARFDPFEVLGVRPGATAEQIRAAYRKQVARYHPDKHRGNPLEELAAKKIVEINQAYEILSNDRRRTEDEHRKSSPSAPRGPSSSSSSPRSDVTSSNSPASIAGSSLARLAGLVIAVLFLIRFGLVLAREVLVLVRGLAVGIASILRLSPVLAIAVVLTIALGTGYFLRSRKGSG